MKRILLLLLALGAVCSLNAKTRKCLYRVTVTGKRAECPVVIRDVPEWAQRAVVSLGGVRRIPSQLDRELGELVFVSDISGSQNFQVLYSSDPDKRVFKKRVHAQMWRNQEEGVAFIVNYFLGNVFSRLGISYAEVVYWRYVTFFAKWQDAFSSNNVSKKIWLD